MGGGSSPRYLPLRGGDSHRASPVGILSGVKCLLEEWAPPQNCGRVETPEAMKLAVHEIGELHRGLSGHVTAEIVGLLFLKTLERVTEARDAYFSFIDLFTLGWEHVSPLQLQ